MAVFLLKSLEPAGIPTLTLALYKQLCGKQRSGTNRFEKQIGSTPYLFRVYLRKVCTNLQKICQKIYDIYVRSTRTFVYIFNIINKNSSPLVQIYRKIIDIPVNWCYIYHVRSTKGCLAKSVIVSMFLHSCSSVTTYEYNCCNIM